MAAVWIKPFIGHLNNFYSSIYVWISRFWSYCYRMVLLRPSACPIVYMGLLLTVALPVPYLSNCRSVFLLNSPDGYEYLDVLCYIKYTILNKRYSYEWGIKKTINDEIVKELLSYRKRMMASHRGNKWMNINSNICQSNECENIAIYNVIRQLSWFFI